MAPSVTRYVAGFYFDDMNPNYVALVRKNRPAWMAGKLNAIGGHVEIGETTIDAMVREFREETGIQTDAEDWAVVCVLLHDDAHIAFYAASGDASKVKTTTDEEICVKGVRYVTDRNAIANLAWLLPMAQQKLRGESTIYQIQGDIN